MVTTQQLANKLNDAMNTIAASMSLKHTFKLMAHLGKAKEGSVIHGILKPVQTNVKSKGGTGAGINSVHSMYVAEFVTPSAIDNYYATIIEQVINALIVAEDGNNFTIGDDTVVWEIECGMPKEYAVRDGVGSSIPMAFTVSVTYTDNALLNGVKVWTLDSNAIPYEAEAVVLNKEGRIIPIYEYKNQQGIMLGQNKQYKFRIPYDKNNVVCTTLQSDILNGDFRKRYTLAYDDGVIQFSTTVSLYQTGDMGTEKTEDPTDIVVSFIDVGNNSFDIGNNTTIEYSIALIDWEFDNISENTLYFASQAAQQAYISDGSSLATSIVNDTTKSTLYMPFYAPNLGTQLNTHVDVDCTWAYDWSTAATHNYAVVRKKKTVITNNTPTTTTQYFYYWVINPVFGANGMLSMDLQMDTIQTYMFDSNLTIPDCMIERAHLNRWVDNGDGTISFDGTPSSKLFDAEPLPALSPMLKRREKLKPKISSYYYAGQNNDINDWIQENVLGWKYVFLSSYGIVNDEETAIKFKAYSHNDDVTNSSTQDIEFVGDSNKLQYQTYNNTSFNGVFGCICVPIYKTDKRIILETLNSTYGAQAGTYTTALDRRYLDPSCPGIILSEDGLKGFETLNNGTAQFTTMKFSTTFPVRYTQWGDYPNISAGNSYYITDSGNLKIASQSSNDTFWFGHLSNLAGLRTTAATSGNLAQGIIWIQQSPAYIPMVTYNSNYNNTFGKNAARSYALSHTFTTDQYDDLTDVLPITFSGDFVWYNRYSNYRIYFRFYNNDDNAQFYYTVNNWDVGEFTDDAIFTKVVESVTQQYKVNFTLKIEYTQVTFSLNSTTRPFYNLDVSIIGSMPAIVGDIKRTEYNPKLYSQNVYHLRLTTDHGGEFDYNTQQLNKPNIDIISSEPIVPDISRKYLRITDINNNVYNSQCDQNLTGLVDAFDNSLPLDTSAYQQMLSENKNFFLQKNIEVGSQIFNTLRSGVGGAAAGAAAGSIVPGVGTAVGAVLGGVGGALSGIVGGAINIANMVIDNNTEQQRSALVKNANGNSFLNMAYTEPGDYVEEYELLKSDKEKVNNFMFANGFSYNQLDNPLDYIHTRKYFNYIKAQIGDIQGVSLSNEIRNDIKQRFANGIRFWDNTTFATNGVQYDKENYELWLETQPST